MLNKIGNIEYWPSSHTSLIFSFSWLQGRRSFALGHSQWVYFGFTRMLWFQEDFGHACTIWIHCCIGVFVSLSFLSRFRTIGWTCRNRRRSGGCWRRMCAARGDAEDTKFVSCVTFLSSFPSFKCTLMLEISSSSAGVAPRKNWPQLFCSDSRCLVILKV